MFEAFTTAEGWVALASLSAMEIVLGIDNIIFISILVAKLPLARQDLARRLGLGLALLMRLLLLFAITWIMRLTAPLFTVLGNEISGRDLILIVGGLFLIGKATFEIHDKLEVDHEKSADERKIKASFAGVLVQIMLLDIVFSLDSVITAVGMAPAISIMVVAMIVAVGVMLAFAAPIGDFVERHPTIKILALSFLLLIGVMLVADGLGQHISKGYVYFAIGFSLVVELINLRVRKVHEAPLRLHNRFEHAPNLEP